LSQKSLGLIETYGLVVGIEAADAAVKSANVQLVGYEFARGSGMTTIKVEGDVGAVNAAISAASAAALKLGGVASAKVIPRPSAGIEMMIRNDDTVGYNPPAPTPDPTPTPPKEDKAKSMEQPEAPVAKKDEKVSKQKNKSSSKKKKKAAKAAEIKRADIPKPTSEKKEEQMKAPDTPKAPAAADTSVKSDADKKDQKALDTRPGTSLTVEKKETKTLEVTPKPETQKPPEKPDGKPSGSDITKKPDADKK